MNETCSLSEIIMYETIKYETIKALIFCHRYLQERIKQAEEEKAFTATALAKCKVKFLYVPDILYNTSKFIF